MQKKIFPCVLKYINVFGEKYLLELTTRLKCDLFSRKLPKGEVPEATEKS